jgi:hypothetical protein
MRSPRRSHPRPTHHTPPTNRRRATRSSSISSSGGGGGGGGGGGSRPSSIDLSTRQSLEEITQIRPPIPGGEEPSTAAAAGGGAGGGGGGSGGRSGQWVWVPRRASFLVHTLPKEAKRVRERV